MWYIRTAPEYKEALIAKLKKIDIHNEFPKERLDDIEMIEDYIELRMGSVLPEYGEKFHEYITRLRDLKGFTNADLAKRTRLSDSKMSKYFNGKGNSKNYVIALLIALELDMRQVKAVFRLTDFTTENPSFENDIINYYLSNNKFNNGVNPVEECNHCLRSISVSSNTRLCVFLCSRWLV